MGGRIITNTPADVDRMCSFIRDHFDVDEENSLDVASRLRESEFGYRSVHYVVQFKPDVFPTNDVDIDVPEKLLGFKAEIQVRTLLQHAWAVIGHDRIYKSPFEVPNEWVRESARLAAAFEQADNSISAMIKGLDAYQTSYGAYMTPEKMSEEINILQIVLQYDPNNAQLAQKIGKLFMCLGKWKEAVEQLRPHRESTHAPLLRDLGVATCKLQVENPQGAEYKRGQGYIEQAIALDDRDTDALASLAGTYKHTDQASVLEYYERAFEIDPTDPYPLGCYIEQRIAAEKSLSIVSALRPSLRGAIARCREQADIHINLPWAMYDTGKFELLLGQPYRSITAYAKAVQLSQGKHMIDTSLASVDSLAVIKSELPELEWVQLLLMVARAAKFPGGSVDSRLASLASKATGELCGPVVFVAGGWDSSGEAEIQDYRDLCVQAFAGFHGTIISAVATAGIRGLLGDISERYGKSSQTIGYAPTQLPGGATSDETPDRYDEIRRTDGGEFTALQPLQAWIDVIASGVDPNDVKLIGIGGGEIAGFEYRLALALGAKVAVLTGSGRAAAALSIDPDWADSNGLLRMPPDLVTLATFVECDGPAADPKNRETLGRAIHAKYQEDRAKEAAQSQKSMADWGKLPETLKNSNLQQADDIARKLRAIGCTTREVTDREIAHMTFTEQEIETMAEMEHARWNLERLLDGWICGREKDVDKKISPYLVSWSELPDDVKEWDRDAVVAIPALLANVGLEVYRAP